MSGKDKFFCGLILLLAVLSIHPIFDPVKLYCFCIPSAALIAAPLGGGTFSMVSGTPVVEMEGLRILVPPSCSGMLFFLLLAFLFPFYKKRKFLFLSYPIALLTNGIRILAVASLGPFLLKSITFLPVILHQTVGIILFLSVLITVSFFLKLFSK